MFYGSAVWGPELCVLTFESAEKALCSCGEELNVEAAVTKAVCAGRGPTAALAQ